jgi:hypothetical protein
MRNPKARSRRLTDGTRWRTFMKLLPLDDLVPSYTNAGAPEPGLEALLARKFCDPCGAFDGEPPEVEPACNGRREEASSSIEWCLRS